MASESVRIGTVACGDEAELVRLARTMDAAAREALLGRFRAIPSDRREVALDAEGRPIVGEWLP